MRNSLPAAEPRRLDLEYATSPQATGGERLAYLLNERHTPADWMAVVSADERAAHRERQHGRFDGRQTLSEYFDIANEDTEGRLPHEPGYCGRWEREARKARSVIELATSEGTAEAALLQLALPVAA